MLVQISKESRCQKETESLTCSSPWRICNFYIRKNADTWLTSSECFDMNYYLMNGRKKDNMFLSMIKVVLTVMSQISDI